MATLLEITGPVTLLYDTEAEACEAARDLLQAAEAATGTTGRYPVVKFCLRGDFPMPEQKRTKTP